MELNKIAGLSLLFQNKVFNYLENDQELLTEFKDNVSECEKDEMTYVQNAILEMGSSFSFDPETLEINSDDGALLVLNSVDVMASVLDKVDGYDRVDLLLKVLPDEMKSEDCHQNLVDLERRSLAKVVGWSI